MGESVIEQVNSIKDLIQLLVSTITLMGLVVVFHKRYISPTLQKVDAMSELIEAQMRENGGGSLIDKVNQIPHLKRDIDEIKDKISKIESEVVSDN